MRDEEIPFIGTTSAGERDQLLGYKTCSLPTEGGPIYFISHGHSCLDKRWFVQWHDAILKDITTPFT